VRNTFSSDRGLSLALLSAFAILILGGGLCYRSIEVSGESDRWVKHTYEVSAGLDGMLLETTNIESDARGFVLTADERYWDAWRAGVATLERQAAAVRSLTSDNPFQQARLPAAEALIVERIRFAEKISALRRTVGLVAAAQAFRSAGGGVGGSEFRDIVRQMQAEEDGLLIRRTADAARRQQQAKIILVVGTVLGLLITAAAGFGLLRDTNRRRLAEGALRDSEIQYRTLLNEVQDYAILMLDPKGRVVTWNSGGERIKGYEAQEIIGKNFSVFFTAEDVKLGRPEEILRIAEANGRHEEQSMRVRKDGTQFAASITYTALRDPAGRLRGFSEIARDLSETKESGAKYRGLLEAAPDAMVVVDVRGMIVLVNLQAEKQFGYRRDELLGQLVSSIVPQGFAERLVADGLRSDEDALAQQIGTGIELIARRKDGSEFPIEIMLSPLRSTEGILVTAAIRNISVRKDAERHLAQMESRYRGLLEAAPDAMVVVNQAGEDRAAQSAGREAIRLSARRIAGAGGQQHHARGVRRAPGRRQPAIRRGCAGAADRHRHRADRAAQGRQRIPDRNHVEPAAQHRGNADYRRDPRHQRAQRGGDASGADGGPLSRPAGSGPRRHGGGESARRDRSAERAGREAVRLSPRRAAGAESEQHRARGLRGASGRRQPAIRRGCAGAADRHRHRADRAAQGRQRIPDRDHAEPAAKSRRASWSPRRSATSACATRRRRIWRRWRAAIAGCWKRPPTPWWW
jgi:PAS domain S-box-containing protein